MASIVLVGFITYAKFIENKSPSKTNYVIIKNDTTEILNNGNPTVDSILGSAGHQSASTSAGSLMINRDSSIFMDEGRQAIVTDTTNSDSLLIIEERMNSSSTKKVRAINEEAQTWFRLLIDFFETVSPLLGPIVSYFFVRRERKKSDQSN